MSITTQKKVFSEERGNSVTNVVSSKRRHLGSPCLLKLKNHSFLAKETMVSDCSIKISEHLAINLFRITATDHKLREDGIRDENLAILTHYGVANEVRAATERIYKKDIKDLPRAFDLRRELEVRRRATQRRMTKEKQAEDGGQETLF